MADDISLGKAVAVVAAGSVTVSLVVGASFWAVEACRAGRGARAWRWLRVRALGGVTALERPLGYSCAMCQYSLDAHEVVRTLSCNHVFHCRESDKCRDVIDKWLCEVRMACPVCRKTPFPVLPWKARPPLSPAPSRPPSVSVEPPSPVSSSGSEEPGLLLSSPELEDRLLPTLE